MSKPLPPGDACWILMDKVPRTPKHVHRDGCYICEDDEFARMGLPLCYPCIHCGGHVPADDIICDDCEKEQDEPT